MRSKDALVVLEQLRDLPLVEGVVAARENVGPVAEEFVSDRRREAEAARGVLRVHHDEVDAVLADHLVHALSDCSPARTAEDVANHQDLHGTLLSLLQDRGYRAY